MKNETEKKVGEVIESIRLRLQADGGDIELVEIKDAVAYVRLQGACVGCPMAQVTLKNFVEAMIKKQVPEIKSVESV